MRIILIFTLLVSISAEACRVGPSNVPEKYEQYFKNEVVTASEDSELLLIRGLAPKKVEEFYLGEVRIYIFMNDVIVSSSALAHTNNNDFIGFEALAKNNDELSYKISVIYGSSRCPRFRYVFES